MSKSKIIAVAALATLLAGHAYAAPQDEGGSAASNPDSAPVCMTREYEADGRKRAFEIITVASDVRALQTKGFVVADCKAAFRTADQQERYRDKVCVMAARFSDEVQTQFAELLGERPAVLCGMAELAVGQWEPSENGKARR
jgi:hypothetical protein